MIKNAASVELIYLNVFDNATKDTENYVNSQGIKGLRYGFYKGHQ